MNAISNVHGRQIFDSRGRPTVEVEITLDSGIVKIALGGIFERVD